MANGKQKENITNPYFKFLIGMFAAVCAAYFPRLLISINNFEYINQSLINFQYFIIIMIFSVMVGIIVVIFEYNIPRSAKATFMFALGVPALVTGTLNNYDSMNKLSRSEQTIQVLTGQMESLKKPFDSSKDIAVHTFENIENSSLQDSNTFFINPLGASTAYAGENYAMGNQSTFDIGIKPKSQQANIYLILSKEKDKNSALRALKDIKKKLPQSRAIKTGKEFLIIYGNKPMTNSEALLKAIEIKEKYDISPGKLEITK